MALARKLLHRRLYSLLEPQNVAFVYHIIHSNPPHYHKIPPPSHHRPFASSSQSLSESDQTHAINSLHSIFEGRTERRSYTKNEKLRGKSKQGEAVGLSEKKGEKKKKKKLRKSRESKVKFVEEEEEVVKEELQGKPEQGEAVGLSEKTGDKKKKKKKLRKSRESKVKFVEEEEEVVKEELQGKPEPGEAVGLSEKTGDKKKKKKKPQKKLRKSRESKVKFVEEEEEVVKEELQGKPEPGEAVGLSEKTGDKKKKKKKPQKKLRTSRESKVKFVEEEEEEAVKEELQGKSEQGEAVSLSEKTEQEKSEVRCIEDKKKKPKKKLKNPGKWKVKLKFIEEEEEEKVVDGEQTKKPEPKRLYDLFSQGEKSKEANRRRLSHGIAPVETHKEINQREPVGLKKLSLDMETFLSYLYKEGYFRDANFVKGKNFDLRWFDIKYARYYTLSAMQKFGKDKQEISKWLSGSDLKQVAMFGCPSDSKSQVFPSKRLRKYFKIPENTVCNKCVLRDSCKFVNQSVWRTDNNNLDLAVAMKVICSYAMSIVHPQLVVPDKVNSSVNRLLKEVLKLSQTF